MKKIITVLLSVLLIAGLFTGCNGESVKDNTPTPTPTPAPTPASTPAETITVTFDANGGTVTRAIESMTVEKGSKVSLPDITGAFEAPYGYQFANCWNTKADGSGTSYNVASPAYKFKKNVTLYAQWNAIPFKFVAQEDNVTIRLNFSHDVYSHETTENYPLFLKYSKTGNDDDWHEYTWADDYDGPEIELGPEEEVYFKAKAPNDSFTCARSLQYYYFVIEGGNVAAEGNIMYLLEPTGKLLTVPVFAFTSLFNNCDNLISAPLLPATTLNTECYCGMFESCGGLTTAPELPATTLTEGCYMDMFKGCESLISAPELPATTLADGCYWSMFANCTGLTTAPELPATTSVINCYREMFANCTGLTTAPELPATTLTEKCYRSMFSGCSSLNSVTVKFTDWNPSNNATTNWLENVASTGTFKCPSALDTTTRNSSYVPPEWNIITTP